MTTPITLAQFEGFRPDRLWSIWELMQELKIGEILRLLHGILLDASFGSDAKAPPHPGARQNLKDKLRELLPYCERLGLLVPIHCIQDALLILDASPPIGHETGAMERMSNMLTTTIEVELRGRSVFVVRPEAAKLFNGTNLFGLDVATKFPSVVYEIAEASKCLALERSTASAFHSIRCLEAGIRALSRCLQIADSTKASDRNWGAMLKTLKDRIDQRWPGSSTRLSGDGEFFDNAYAALAAMQNRWRNATMHLDQKYTDEEARHIFEVVKGFMKKLASRIDEDGKPLA